MDFGCRCSEKHNPILISEGKRKNCLLALGHKENLQEHAMVALIFQLKYKYNV